MSFFLRASPVPSSAEPLSHHGREEKDPSYPTKPLGKELETDPCVTLESEKAHTITFFNFRTKQMRAFHLAWFSFFMAFVAWFSVAPLMPAIKETLHLTKKQVNYGNLASVSTTIIARIIMGPLSDRFGPKTTMAIVLAIGAVPVFCVGAIQSWQDLVAVRAAIGVLGASFVMAQAWTSNMFQHNIVGTANAVVGGWGNLGGGVTQVLMVAIFAAFVNSGMSEEQAWRRSFTIPAAMLVATAVIIYLLGDDTPKGDLRMLKKAAAASGSVRGQSAASTMSASMGSALSHPATYVLAIQYAASFGVEITVFNQAATYFHDVFKVSVVKAGNLALLAGITNIFARALGGYISDIAYRRYDMMGRLIIQFLLVVAEGAFLLWFSYARSYTEATGLLIVFSIFVQAANGSCFAIVPHVSKYKGSVSGLVGAGGNIGAMVFALLFLFGEFGSIAEGYQIMGYAVLAGACSMVFIRPSSLKVFGKEEVERTMHLDRDSEEESSMEEDEEAPKPRVTPMEIDDSRRV